jgi:hypothetical protein
MDNDGNETDIVWAWLVPGQGIRFALNEDAGYTVADAIDAQPFSLTYEAVGVVGDPSTLSSATLTLNYADVGLLRRNVQKTVPNVTGAEVVINLSEILDPVAGALPEGWSHQFSLVAPPVLPPPALVYPIGSRYTLPDGTVSPLIPTPAGSVAVNADRDRITYTHTAMDPAQLYTYVYLNVETRKPNPTPPPLSINAGSPAFLWNTFIQICIALQPENEMVLSDEAIDLEYTTNPRQAVFNVPFVNAVILGAPRQGVTSVSADNAAVRTASYGLPIQVVNGQAEGVYLPDPEMVRILTGGNELAPALPEGAVLVDGVVVATAFHDEDDLLIITEQQGVVRFDGARFVYTPPRGFTGVDSFQYTITDGTFVDDDTLNTASATITITVPEADEWTVINIDPPADIERLIEIGTSSGVIALGGNNYKDVGTAPANGSIAWQRQVVQNAIGILAGNFIYTPNAGWTGTDTFEYRQFRGGLNVWSDPATALFVVTSAAGVDEAERRPIIQFGPVLSQNINTRWVRIWVSRNGSAYHSEWLAPQEVLPGAGGGPITYQPAQFWQPIAHLPGGNYVFWVQPWGPQMGFGPWYPVREYELMSRAPEAVTLVSPIGGVYVDNPSVNYTWTHDRDATWYRIWIERDGGRMVDDWINMGPGVVNAPTIARLIDGHVIDSAYEWWIRPWGPDGFGPWSDSGEFTRILE